MHGLTGMRSYRLTLLLFAAAAGVAAGSGKISRDLTNVDSSREVDVIIQYKQPPAERHLGKIGEKGGRVKDKFEAIKGAAVSISRGKLAELANDPDVDYISPDRPVSGALDYTAPTVQAPTAWSYGLDGRGIGVAVIDSGVSGVTDLKGRVV